MVSGCHILFLEAQLIAFRSHLDEALVSSGEEVLHEGRLNRKRILMMANWAHRCGASGRLKKPLRVLSSVSAAMGGVRDLQVSLSLVNHFCAPDGFEEFSLFLQRKIRRAFNRLKHTAEKWTFKKEAELLKQCIKPMHHIRDQKCKRLASKHLLDLSRVLVKVHTLTPYERALHRARMRVKELLHFLGLLEACGPSCQIADEEYESIRTLAHLLGDWNDRVMLIRQIYIFLRRTVRRGDHALTAKTERLLEAVDREREALLRKIESWNEAHTG